VTIEILPRAREDIVNGFHFYEQRETGLGTYFRDSLLADVDALHRTAGVHARAWGYHRSFSQTFPFAIYYRLSGGLAVVHAILDCRRDPKSIRRALRTLIQILKSRKPETTSLQTTGFPDSTLLLPFPGFLDSKLNIPCPPIP